MGNKRLSIRLRMEQGKTGRKERYCHIFAYDEG